MKSIQILLIVTIVGLLSACTSQGHHNNEASTKQSAHSSVHTLPKYETRFQPKYYSENHR